MTGSNPQDLTLAIYATSKGFAFVLFSGPLNPFDWGTPSVKNPSRNRKCLASIARIVEEFHPLAIVLEDTSETQSRRTARIRRLYQSIVHLASVRGIDVHRVGKPVIRSTFSPIGAVTKYEI